MNEFRLHLAWRGPLCKKFTQIRPAKLDVREYSLFLVPPGQIRKKFAYIWPCWARFERISFKSGRARPDINEVRLYLPGPFWDTISMRDFHTQELRTRSDEFIEAMNLRKYWKHAATDWLKRHTETRVADVTDGVHTSPWHRAGNNLSSGKIEVVMSRFLNVSLRNAFS